MKKKLIFDSNLLKITLDRLCQELIENHGKFDHSVLLGLQPRGIFLVEYIKERLSQITKKEIQYGYLDATFYRDDFRRKDAPISAHENKIPFLIENKKVVLIDDVLFTGRTVRAALDAMLAFGRPKKVELFVLIDRKYSREFPIAADYVGRYVNTHYNQHVLVEFNSNDSKIWLMNKP